MSFFASHIKLEEIGMSSTGFFSLLNLQWHAENSSFCLGEFQLDKELITAWEFGYEIVPAWK
jgi:hypothetical protein